MHASKQAFLIVVRRWWFWTRTVRVAIPNHCPAEADAHLTVTGLLPFFGGRLAPTLATGRLDVRLLYKPNNAQGYSESAEAIQLGVNFLTLGDAIVSFGLVSD